MEARGFGKSEKVVDGSRSWHEDAGLLEGGLKSGNGYEDGGLDAEAGVSSPELEASSSILAGSSCGLVAEAIWPAEEGGEGVKWVSTGLPGPGGGRVRRCEWVRGHGPEIQRRSEARAGMGRWNSNVGRTLGRWVWAAGTRIVESSVLGTMPRISTRQYTLTPAQPRRARAARENGDGGEGIATGVGGLWICAP